MRDNGSDSSFSSSSVLVLFPSWSVLSHRWIHFLFLFSFQVLIHVLSSRQNLSNSLAFGRLHPQLESNTLLVDCKSESLSQFDVKTFWTER